MKKSPPTQIKASMAATAPVKNMPIQFETESALVAQLVTLLEQEQAALSHLQLDVMEQVLDQKTQLIHALSEASFQRYQALQQLGLQDNESGMQVWLMRHASAEQGVAWQLFQTALARSQELNRVNGLLVSKFFNRNQQLLNVLQNGGMAAMYGPNGQTAIHSGMRGSIKA